MAVPYYDFLTSAPTDQTGSALGTDFDYYNAFLNNSQYYQPGTGTADVANFTIGDQEYSFPSGSTYGQLEKYMTDKGASDLLTRTSAIAPIDGGSDSTGIGEIILPPIAGGGGGGGGGVTPEFLKTYTTGDNTTGATTVNMSSNPAAYLTGKGRLDPMGSGFYDTLNMIEAKDPSSYKMSTFNKDFAPSAESGQISYDPKINPNILKAFYESVYQEPQKQNFLQKGIGSIKDFFTDSKFFQPKIQGQLGTRLAKQYTMGQKLPSFITAIAQTQSPFNPKSKNYNALLEDQLNIAEANDKVGRDPNSGHLKYNENSVLSGQNVISGFGTNDYEKQLEKYLEKVQGVFDKKYNKTNLTELEKQAATKYKTKYITSTITELNNLKNNKTYIEKKKQIEEENKIKEQKKIEKQKQIELQKKIEADYAAGKSLSQIGKENFTGQGMAFQAGNTDQGGGVTKGKVQKSSSVPGGYYGSPRKDGGIINGYEDGGRVRKSYFDGGIVTL